MGKEPSLYDIFIKTHKRKDNGDFVDQRSADAYVSMVVSLRQWLICWFFYLDLALLGVTCFISIVKLDGTGTTFILYVCLTNMIMVYRIEDPKE